MPPSLRQRCRLFSDEMASMRSASSVDSPPPCGEGSGVGVVQCGDAAPNRATPLPSPPPQGGREQTECVVSVGEMGARSMRRILWAIALAATCASGAVAQGTIRVAVGTSLNQLDAAKTTMGDEYIYVH